MARIETIKNKYKNDGLWAATKEVPAQGWDLVKENKGKTALVVGTLVVLAALTTAYFMSPAYANFVGAAGAKAATLVSPAIAAVSAFLVAHPLIATVAIIGLVAAVITAGVLAYKNNDKANKIDEAGKILNGNDASTKISDIKIALGLEQAPAK